MTLKDRTLAILTHMKKGAFERERPLALSLLCAMAGESIFLLGLPGVGKSMIARKLKSAFHEARTFEYLMSRFSTPDEIFGPVSISRLKNEDCYERVTDGYLPDAEVVFLDEIWKAGPAIQNSLLTVLNEKIYLNGNKELHLPVKGIIAASNELPASGEGLEALWDRFLVRYIVEPIKRRENFFRLLDNPQATVKESTAAIPFSDEEYREVSLKSAQVAVGDDIKETLFRIRERLLTESKVNENDDDDENESNASLYVSDRRWKKAVGLMRTSALLNGRTRVEPSDLLLLEHMLWNDESEIETVNRILADCIVKMLLAEVLEKISRKPAEPAPDPDSDPDGNSLYKTVRGMLVVQCDDLPLRLSLKDYEMMLKDKGGYYFASETSDGRLVVGDAGQYTIKVAKEGFVCINSYNYPILTRSDRDRNDSFLRNVGEMIENIINGFFRDTDRNIFTSGSDMLRHINSAAGLYRNRFNRL